MSYSGVGDYTDDDAINDSSNSSGSSTYDDEIEKPIEIVVGLQSENEEMMLNIYSIAPFAERVCEALPVFGGM